MRKHILIILLVLLLIPVSINAEKVYTKDYFIEGENPKEYPYKSNKFIIKNNKKETIPEKKKNRIVKEEITYGYNQMSIRYIVINNFALTTNTYFSELEIFNKEKEIDFNYTCQNCYGNLITNLTNNIYENDLDRPIMASLKIVIDLKSYYRPQDLKFNTSFSNPNKEKFQSGYDIWLSKEEPVITNERQTFPKSIIYKRPLNISKERENAHFTFENQITKGNILTKIYDEEIIYFKEKQSEDFYSLKEVKTIYNYQDILFKYYKKINVKEKNNIKSNKQEQKKINNDHIFYNQNISTYSSKRKVKHINYEQNKKNQIKKIKKIATPKMEQKKITPNKLSNNILTKVSNIDTKTPIILGIFVVLLLGMVYALYNLKKEK